MMALTTCALVFIHYVYCIANEYKLKLKIFFNSTWHLQYDITVEECTDDVISDFTVPIK